MQERCKFFWELMTVDKNADGSDRLLPVLTVSRIPGGYRCVIQDIETSQQKAFSFERLTDLAVAAEYAVIDPRVPWVAFNNKRNPKGIERHDKKKA